MATLNITNAKRFSDLVAITEASDDAVLLIHDGNGVKTITVGDFKKDIKTLVDAAHSVVDDMVTAGAGSHNSVYRGKYLGDSVTAAQYAAISAGTFEDLYLGDYWIIGEVTYRIAAFDYYYQTGDPLCTSHHVTLVPDSIMYKHKMHDSNSTAGAYVGALMYTEGLNQAKETINAAFGSDHVLNHRQYLPNAATSGYVTGASWYDSTVELMNEQNVYGCRVFCNETNGTTVASGYTLDKSQYPLFAVRPDLISCNDWYWLRDVASAGVFAGVNGKGYATYTGLTSVFGVRPAFSIIG